mgnify:CR=1 FL=1
MKTSERHLFVLKFKDKYAVKHMCISLKISESGYYRWLKNRCKQTSRQLLLVIIKEILSEHPDNDNYGVKRVKTALFQRGITVSHRTVYRTMKEGCLLHKRRKPHGITKATTEIQEKENLIKRDFKSDKPLTKLLTDITEIPCCDGKLYVSPVMDCFNGEIIALQMRGNMKKELCVDTVKQLGKLSGAILHSDRGSQYTSADFRDQLKTQGIIQSLSGAGRCYDNSRMESFFATLKKEKLYRIPTYRMTREEVKSVIFRYIFGYYNTQRITSFNPGGWPPVKYRELLKASAA